MDDKDRKIMAFVLLSPYLFPFFTLAGWVVFISSHFLKPDRLITIVRIGWVSAFIFGIFAMDLLNM